MNQITKLSVKQYIDKLDADNLVHFVIAKKLKSLNLLVEWLEVKNIIEETAAVEIKALIRARARINKNSLGYKFNKKINQITQPIRDKSPFMFRYMGFVLLLLFVSALGAGMYNQFYKKAGSSLAYPVSPTSPGSRTVSFQGRLTDNLGNPITANIAVEYNFYNAIGQTNPILTRSCNTQPDQDGIFNNLIGEDCGAVLPDSLFTENANIYLGVKVGSDAEMTPRQQIANVGYAINSETLQGLPPGTAPSTIPFINSTGSLQIAAANPKIESTQASATFAITSASAVTIQSADTGDINLNAAGTGNINFQIGSTDAMTIDNNGQVGIGTAIPNYPLDVQAGTGIVANFSGRVAGANALSNNEFVTLGQMATGAGPWTRNSSNVYLTSGGDNVGIGTTAPTHLLDVNGLGRIGGVHVGGYGTTTNDKYISTEDTWMGFLNQSGSPIPVKTGGLVVNSGSYTPNAPTGGAIIEGNVGIGTTDPLFKLDINGSVNIASGQTYNVNGSQIALNNLGDVIIAAPITDQILRYNGTNWINGSETTVNGGSGVDYFYVDSPSDISTYAILNKVPDPGSEIHETVTANNNRVLFDSYASASTGLGGSQIDAGVWSFDIWAYVDNITGGTSSVDIDVYKRTAGGLETLLFNVNSGTLDTTLGVNPNIVTTIQQAFAINATDRLITKVYGKTTAVADRTVHFLHGGNAHYSHLNTPLVVRHNDLAGLQGGTSNEYYHLTAAEYTGSGTGIFARMNAPIFTSGIGVTGNSTFNNNLVIGGNVGIGTTNPINGKLEVAGKIYTTNFQMTAGATNGNVMISDASGNASWTNLSTLPVGNADTTDNYHISGSANYLSKFNAANNSLVNSLLYDDGTNVGIGTTSPTAKLDINGSYALLKLTEPSTAYDNYIKFYGGSTYNGEIGYDATNGGINIAGSTGTGLFVQSGGNVGIGTATPGTAGLAVMNGNVGIGTTNPGTRLEVSGTAYPVLEALRLTNVANISSDRGVKQTFYIPTGTLSTRLGGEIKVANDTALTGSYMSFSTEYGVGGTVAERMRITNSGNVGIGTTNPSSTLHIQSAAVSGSEVVQKWTVSDDATANLNISNGSSSNGIFAPVFNSLGNSTTYSPLWFVGTVSSDSGSVAAVAFDGRLAGGALSTRPLVNFASYGVSKMMILANGNVGIGTTAPAEKLEVAGTIRSNYDYNSTVTFIDGWAANDYQNVVQVTPDSGGASGLYEISISSLRGSLAEASTYLSAIDHANGNVWRETGITNDNSYVAGTRCFTVDTNGNSGAVQFRVRALKASGVCGAGGNLAIGVKIRSIGRNTAWSTLAGGGTGGTVTGFQSMAGNSWNLYTGNPFSGAGNIAISANASGNVGIGTTNPINGKLEVNGKIYTTNFQMPTGASNGNVMISDASGNASWTNLSSLPVGNANTTDSYHIGGSANYLTKFNAANNTLVNSLLYDDGTNVGIGTTGPKTNLQVGSGTFPTYNLAGIGIANGASSYSFFSASDNTKQWIGGIDNNINYGKEGMVSNHDLAIITNNAARIYIQSGGNVGIGTTGPTSLLHIRKDQNAGTALNIENQTSGTTGYSRQLLTTPSANAWLDLYSALYTTSGANVADGAFLGANGTGGLSIGGVNGTSGLIKFFTDGSADANERMRITNGGNVGIGTTNPGATLHVYRSSLTSPSLTPGAAATMIIGQEAPGELAIGMDSGSPYEIYMQGRYLGGTARNISINPLGGNVGIGTTNPSLGKLQVAGRTYTTDFTMTNGASNGKILVSDSSGLATWTTPSTLSIGNADTTDNYHISGSANYLSKFNAANNTLVASLLYDNGTNVGIGITNPLSKFVVLQNSGISTSMVDFTNNLDSDIGFFVSASGASDKVGLIQAVGNLAFGAGSAEKMRINTSGNVGIGTTNPGELLTINNASRTEIALALGGTIFGRLANASQEFSGQSNTDFAITSAGTNSKLQLGANGVLGMTLNSSGNVGIGTTSPGYKLTVISTGTAANSQAAFFQGANGGYTAMAFTGDNSAEVGAITTYGGYIMYGSQNAGLTGSNAEIAIKASSHDVILGGAALGVVSGNVGIGTTNPSLGKLQVAGRTYTTDFTMTNGASNGKILVSDASGNASWTAPSAMNVGNADTVDGYNISGNANYITKFNAANNSLVNSLLYDDGTNVGIGTTAPQYKLSLQSSVDNYLSSIYNTGATANAGGLYIRTDGNGNLLTLNSSGSDIMTVSPTSTTFNTPTSFTASGDVSFAYDINMTNSVASYIKSAASMTMQAGEVFNSSDLTMRTFNYGDLVLDTGVGVTSAGGTIKFNDSNVKGATDTTSIAFADTPTTVNNFRTNFTNESLLGAINETYNMGIGASNGLWLDGGNYVYPNATYATNLVVPTGNVGIGNTNPSSKLTINTGNILFSDNWGMLWDAAANTNILASAADGFKFTTNGTEKVRIANGGNVGIGTTNPGAKLEVIKDYAGSLEALMANFLNPSQTDGSYNYITVGKSIAANGNAVFGFTKGATVSRAWIGLWGDDVSNGTGLTVQKGGNVGIGTAAPAFPLEVASSGSSGWVGAFGNATKTAQILLGVRGGVASVGTTGGINMSLNPDGGNVGIGTTAPAAKLEVLAPSLGNNLNDVVEMQRLSSSNSNYSYLDIRNIRTAAGSDWGTAGMRIQEKIDTTWMGYMQFNGNNNGGGVSFGTGMTTTAPGNVTEAMRIASNGYIGIGTTNPNNFKLQIAGSIGPQVADSYDLGSSANHWNNVYANSFVGAMTPSGFTQGPVVFGGAAGALAQDNGLFWDNTNKRLGIGTTNPGAPLEISTPTGVNFQTGIRLQKASGYGQTDIQNYYTTGSNYGLAINIGAAASAQMVVNNSGNVGIGNTNPGQKLDVNGQIRAYSGFTGDAASNIGGTGAAAYFPNGVYISGSQQWIYGAVTFNGALSGATTINASGAVTAPTYLFPAPAGDPSPVITARTVPAGQGAAIEKTELILFHSNDNANGSGPDQITLRAPALSFQTYDNTAVASITDNAGYNERMYIAPGGNVGIGTTNPNNFKLQVAGSVGPQVADSYDLGSSANHWNNVYANSFVGAMTPSGFTQGPVVFGGAAGALAQDNALFWDNTNKRLGIGTAASSTKLEIDSNNAPENSSATPLGGFSIKSTASTALVMGVDAASPFDGWLQVRHGTIAGLTYPLSLQPMGGNVGIGTVTPGAKLEVAGKTIIDANDSATNNNNEGLRINVASNNYALIQLGGASGSAVGTGANQWGLVKSGADGSFYIAENGSIKMTILPTSGNVGIGTVSPGQKLQVNGDIGFGSTNGNGVLGAGAGYGCVGCGAASTIQFYDTSNGAMIFNTGYTASYYSFKHAGTEVLNLGSTGVMSLPGNGYTIYGPNSSWGAYLQVGGNGRQYVDNASYASVATTDGNLHMDAASGKVLYLNYYDGSSINFGNGANGTNANVSAAGAFTGTNFVGPGTGLTGTAAGLSIGGTAATATNALQLNGLASTAFQQRVSYGTTAQNSGYYKINIIPATSWMLSFTIRLYQSYRYDDIRISGYNNGGSYWYTPLADLLNSSATNIDVRFGYDSAWNLWVAVPASSYTGLEIIDITNGYVQVNQDWSKNFTIVNQASLTGTVQTTQTVYRPLKYNENAVSATNAGYATTAGAVNFGGDATKQLLSPTWAGTGGYPGYQFTGGNSRFGFSSTGGGLDVYADGNFYATDNGYLVLHAANYGSYSSFSGVVTGTSFSGAGTGLTGTAAGLSIGGNAATATTLIGNQSNWSDYRTSAVANMLSWKNYGNGHVIFDASASTSPTGSAVNNTNAAIAWSGTYPTLMGWNGTSTYGVRVDSARVSDNTTGNANTATSATSALRLVFNDGPRNLSDRLPNSFTSTVNFDFVTAGTGNGTGNYAGVMSFSPWTGTTASTGDSSYQLAFANNSGVNASGMPKLSIRNGIDTTWKSWYAIPLLQSATPGEQQTGNLNISGTGLFAGNLSASYFMDYQNNAYGIDPAGTTNFGGYSLKVTGGALLALDSGNVGIGTTAPTQKLDVSGNINLNTDGDSALFSTYKGSTGAIGLNIWIGGGGQSSTTGYRNYALGFGALQNNTAGYENIAIGNAALQSNTTGYLNTAIGTWALQNNTTGRENIAIGREALQANITGYLNTAVGRNALYHNTFNGNSAIGYAALQNNTTGGFNTATGVSAGGMIDSGSYNTFLGFNAGYGSYQLVSASNSMALGNAAYTTASNQVVIGNSSITQTLLRGNVGIGNTNPQWLLHMGPGGGYYNQTTGVWSQASDRKFKTDIVDLTKYGLDTIKNLRPVSYIIKASGVEQVGFIAQEVNELVPELVSEADGSMGLNYAGFSPILVKGIQEQEVKIDANTGDIASLAAKIKNIVNVEDNKTTFQGTILTDVLNAGNALVDTFTATSATISSLIANNIAVGMLNAENAVINTLTAVNANIDNLIANNITANNKIISPVVETKQLITEEITASDEADLAINIGTILPSTTGDSILKKVIFKGFEGKTVASIDSLGNATFSGSLVAHEASFEAGIIASTLNTKEASISGNLIAKNVNSENIQAMTNDINDIQTLLADIKNQPIVDTSNTTNLATTTNLTNIGTGASNSFDDITVANNANMYNASVANSLAVGNLLVKDNTIMSLSWDLKLTALSTVNILDGAIVMAKDGSITSRGSMIAMGGVRTNNISPVSQGADLNINIGSTNVLGANTKFKITNELGETVASIDSSGSAKFNEIALAKDNSATNSAAIIAKADNFTENGIFAPAIQTTNRVAGNAILPNGENEIVIYNEKISKDSLVYVTATSPTQNKTLFVADKNICDGTDVTCKSYFKVAIDDTITSDIKFNWWIVN